MPAVNLYVCLALTVFRGALACVAQLSEQSTFTLERRISTANLMIGEQVRGVHRTVTAGARLEGRSIVFTIAFYPFGTIAHAGRFRRYGERRPGHDQ